MNSSTALLFFSFATAIGLFAIQILSIPRSDLGTDRGKWRRRWILFLLPIALAIPYLSLLIQKQSAETSAARHDEIVGNQERTLDTFKTQPPQSKYPDDPALARKYPLGYIIFGSDEGVYSAHLLNNPLAFGLPRLSFDADWEQTEVTRLSEHRVHIRFQIRTATLALPNNTSGMEVVENEYIILEVNMRKGEVVEAPEMPLSELIHTYLEVVDDSPKKPQFVLGFVRDATE